MSASASLNPCSFSFFTNTIKPLQLQDISQEQIVDNIVEDFKKALSQNEVLQEFDRGIFESIIEKVIVGGYDEDGNKDPYKITFIYKTGFTQKERPQNRGLVLL